MKQYCRYCAFCFEGDGYCCSFYHKELSEEQIKRVNHCKEFGMNGEDIITGKEYRPRDPYSSRRKKPKVTYTDLF